MIYNQFQDKSLYLETSDYRLVGQTRADKELLLTCEHSLSLSVGGSILQRFTCSPAQLPELCLGWLCGEGLIAQAEDIRLLEIAPDGLTARADIGAAQKRELVPFSALATVDDVLCAQAAERLMNGDNVHRKTRGTHQCIFVSGGDVVISCEDIGRSNAMDKTIGSVLLHGLRPESGLLFSSGRITAEIVKKAVHAGFPVLVSKAAVTADAMETAKKYRMQLAFFADSRGYVTGL